MDWRRLNRIGSPLLALAGLVALAGCTALAQAHFGPAAQGPLALKYGPTVRAINATDVELSVRVWVGIADVREDAEYRDMRTGGHLATTIPPGESWTVNAGRQGWLTGEEDGVVWVRLQPLATEAQVEWFELGAPGPYELTGTGTLYPEDPLTPPEPIRYSLADEKVVTPLPRSIWIENHDGVFPIRGE